MSQENLTITEPAKSNIPVAFRISLVLLGTFFIGGLFSFITSIVLSGGMDTLVHMDNMNLKHQFWIQAAGLAGTIAVVFFFRRDLDNRSISSMGFPLKGKSKDLLWGFIVPASIIVIGTTILYISNSISIIGIDFNASDFIYGFLLFIIVALNEEILCRGYILNNLMDTMNPYWSLIISSSLFTLMHGFNDNLSWLGFFDLFIAGILLGSTYIYTRNLWFPISFHLFWNFIQGSVFDYNVSGLNINSLFKFDMIVKNSFNGGDFGFEGSWLCTLLNIVAIAFIFYYYKRQNIPVLRKQSILS